MRDIGIVIGVVALIVLAGFGLVAQANAYQKCGFTKSLIYGKNLVFAEWMGWCDGGK